MKIPKTCDICPTAARLRRLEQWLANMKRREPQHADEPSGVAYERWDSWVVQQQLNVTRQTLCRWSRDQTMNFPAPVAVVGNLRYWKADDIRAFVRYRAKRAEAS